MTTEADIFKKLSEMIGTATERVKICAPSNDYYRRSGDWWESEIDVINASHLSGLLIQAAEEIEQTK
jgi:hypothetical protein